MWASPPPPPLIDPGLYDSEVSFQKAKRQAMEEGAIATRLGRKLSDHGFTVGVHNLCRISVWNCTSRDLPRLKELLHGWYKSIHAVSPIETTSVEMGWYESTPPLERHRV